MNPQDPNNPQPPQNMDIVNPPSPQSGGTVGSELQTPNQPGASSGQPVVSPPNKSGKGKKALISLLVLVLLGGAGVGVYSVLSQTDSTNNGDTAAHKKTDINQLTVGVIGGSIALYPKSTSDSYAETISQQVYEGLVIYQDQTKIVPLLATGWNNPDSSTWDFDLRKDVTFHNGNAMKAADVVASLNAAKQNPDLGIYNDTLGEIKALNDYKVQIKTTKPDPFLLNKLAYLGILDSKHITDTDTQNATGPYLLKSGTKPSDAGIQLQAYEKYWGGHVYIKNLNFTIEPDEATATKDIKSGKINMAGEFTSTDPAELRGANLQKIVVDDPAVTFMTLNTAQAGPLQNVKVRQALKMSLDIPTLISKANVAAEPASQLVTKAIPGYDPSINVVKQDKTKAKQLLAEAGYPSGITLNLEITTQNQELANQVASQAKEVGITVNVVADPDFDTLVDRLLSGKTQMAILSYSSDLQDSSEVFDTVLVQTGNYKSEALNKYLEQAAGTLDQEKRLKYLQQASKSLDEDVAAIPLFNRQRSWFTDRPYAIQFDNVSTDPGVYFWKAYLTN